MKTLNEVIKALENVALADTDGESEGYFLAVDSLHYLKEYRETKKHLACLDDVEIRGDNTQVVNNPPLTWDELRTMEGKPVWVVVDGKERWRIIREVSSEHLILESGLPLHRCWMNYPDGWQAYRKERSH